MSQRARFVWFLIGGSVIINAGCSCSRIPESPPGPGTMSEIRHFNSGTTVPVAVPNPENPTAPPPPNTYVNPTPPPPPTYVRPGYPQPQRPTQPTAPVVTQNSGLGDRAPDGPTLKPSFSSDSNPKKK